MWMTGLAVALVLGAVGCRRGDDVTEARRDLVEEASEARRELGSELAANLQDVNEARAELASEIREAEREGERVTVVGFLSEAAGERISVRTLSGLELELALPPEVQAISEKGPIASSLLREGNPVRASYRMRGDERKLDAIEVVTVVPIDRTSDESGATKDDPRPQGGEE